MRLQFGPGDDDAYHAARVALLHELDCWLDRPPPERAGVVTDVEIFLDWRYHESSGVLDDFSPGDVTQFLLDWCPRRFAGHVNGAEFLCNAVGVYVDFMAASGRLVGGIDRANRLRRLAADLLPTVREEMGSPTAGGGDSDTAGAPGSYELPFVYVPPPAADVEAAAVAAPLLAKFDALRDYLGPDGQPLTDAGNLKLVDGRALVELLDTGDEMDLKIGNKTWRTRSTAKLQRLNLIVAFAKAAGAVRTHRHRLVPVKAWEMRPAVARAEALFSAVVELGPSQSRSSGRVTYFNDLHELLDDGVVHWLAPLLAQDTAEMPFESFLEWAQSVVSRHLDPYWADEDMLDTFTDENMSFIFEILEEAGVVRWTDRQEVPKRFGRSYWTAGTVALTAFGRHVLPDYLDDAGYVLHRAGDVQNADGAGLIDAMLTTADTGHEDLVANWQPDRAAIERVQMLSEAIVAASSAASRVMGFTALHMFAIEEAEPFVRQMLDTPVAGHAALWLIQRGCASPETLASFVDIAVLVDVLASDLADPEGLCSFFTSLSEPLQVLENMWRHPAAETGVVLDALGQHLPDKALAKAARRAAVRHRSWLPNRLG
ncbi:hypothetical protein [Mycobacterium angelicum]|uniref:Uncharacterized protein n=1 Tax=Mycobacterium angelicum TaxID=470074 RepID=A0A1W9ZGC7_MYCAN|nr:hypothetical protein [Mycobacterium angelicum]MCV7195731.1 hypothetical protein [Mycobacterium angelicum]ORA14680.1 hypothetical protein BST12_22710 [Mycobacterium angelicum]